MLITDKAFPIKERFLILIKVRLRRPALPRRVLLPHVCDRRWPEPGVTPFAHRNRSAFPRWISPSSGVSLACSAAGACVCGGMCRLRAPNEEKIQLSAANDIQSEDGKIFFQLGCCFLNVNLNYDSVLRLIENIYYYFCLLWTINSKRKFVFEQTACGKTEVVARQLENRTEWNKIKDFSRKLYINRGRHKT